MNPCPRIVSFCAPDAPEMGWIAMFGDVHDVVKDGRVRYAVPKFLPMVFGGKTQAIAEDTAERWWLAEQQKEEAQRQKLDALAEGRRRRWEEARA